jgi:hypothetical protein
MITKAKAEELLKKGGILVADYSSGIVFIFIQEKGECQYHKLRHDTASKLIMSKFKVTYDVDSIRHFELVDKKSKIWSAIWPDMIVSKKLIETTLRAGGIISIRADGTRYLLKYKVAGGILGKLRKDTAKKLDMSKFVRTDLYDEQSISSSKEYALADPKSEIWLKGGTV